MVVASAAFEIIFVMVDVSLGTSEAAVISVIAIDLSALVDASVDTSEFEAIIVVVDV